MSCGIYKWTSPSGKSYIGQSVNLECRKQDFITNKLYTTKNKRSLTVIDRARKKYPDFEQWTYEILEFCNPNELNDKEQYYIKLFDTFKNGYNETSGGGQSFEISDEAKEKLRQANLGKTLSDETKEKMRQVHLGKTLSDEAKEKMRQAHNGKTHSDETKEKIRQANLGKIPWIKGKTHSDETREKIRQANLGKTLSDEHKEKIRQANLGKTPWIKGKTFPKKQINQYALDGTFIKTWDSANDIDIGRKILTCHIYECCNGKRKSAYGFIWRYHN